MWLVSRPASDAASSTADPKPPISAASSTVTTKASLANRPENRLGIQRLQEPRVHHADLEPFVAQAARAAAMHAGSSAPQQTIVPSSPHERTSLFPNSSGARVPETVSAFAFGYRIAQGPSCRSASSSIFGKSDSSPGAITAIFGSTRKYPKSNVP